jgi:hypothetical protein
MFKSILLILFASLQLVIKTQLSESDKKNLRLVIGRQYSDELNKIELQELEKLALFLEREDERINEWRKVIEKTRAGELPEKYLPAKRPID